VSFFEGGAMVRQQTDSTGDNAYDQQTFFDLQGRPATEAIDTNADGQPDIRKIYVAGVQTEQREDRNFDGTDDQITRYVDGKPVDTRTDTSFDGNFDTQLHLTTSGTRDRQEEDTDGDGRVDTVSHFEGDVLTRQEADTTKDGLYDSVSFFSKAQRVRVETDKNADGVADKRTYFRDGSEDPHRVEEDTNLDGIYDATITLKDGVAISQELDSDADGNIDQWLSLYADGQVRQSSEDNDRDGRADTTIKYDTSGNPTERSEDADEDGVPNRVVRYRDGKPREVEEDSAGKGCFDHKQVLDDQGELKQDFRDTDGNCKYDTTSFLEGGVIVRREIDTNKNGIIDVWVDFANGRRVLQAEARGRCSRPNIVIHFDPESEEERVLLQEEDRNCNGRPDRLTRFDAEGLPSYRCTPYEVIEYSGGVVDAAREDSTHDGWADRRQIFEDGNQTRLDADTNADRLPDVWITFEAGQASLQMEDSNFDGSVDQQFDLAAEAEVPLQNGGQPPSIERFDRVRCRDFSGFWRRGS
jgi:hypothetical protein